MPSHEKLLPLGFYGWSTEQRLSWLKSVDEAHAERSGIRRDRSYSRTQSRVAAELAKLSPHICVIPGCRDRASRRSRLYDDDRTALPLCLHHGIQIADDFRESWFTQEVEAARAHRAARINDTREERIEALEKRWADEEAAYPGDVYFVRVGNLIKVGWSKNLHARLKQYGASAEVLCHFTGTRQDETNLHRQLRPQLAKGREWYHDSDVMAGVVADYVKRHGRPTAFPDWTTPRPDMVAKKRHAA